jgi:hypothetical protein
MQWVAHSALWASMTLMQHVWASPAEHAQSALWTSTEGMGALWASLAPYTDALQYIGKHTY